MMIKNVLLTSCCFALIACGGGGGGGSSSSGGSGGSGSGGGSGSVNTSFPASFTASVQENQDGPDFIQESFLYFAPSDTLPTNVSITGPDAALFVVFIEATATANSNGDRTITVRAQRNPDTTTVAGFNFEAPEDADQDNSYQFSVSALYQGRTVSSDFTLTISDDPSDADELTGTGFVTALPGGVGQNKIPDITGDGLPELALSFSGDTAYIVGSETLATATSQTDITQAGNHLLRFDVAVDSPNRVPRVSAIENAAGGVELLISSAEGRQAIFYRIPQARRDGTFTKGTIAVTSAATDIGIIDMPPAFSSSLGEWVDDVDGDGRPDVFFGGDGSNGTSVGAFLFDTASLYNADAQADFDIQVSHNVSTTLGEIQGVTVAGDLDADDIPDVFIYGPSLTSFVSGSLLQNATTTSIDLSDLAADEGLTYEDGVADVVLFTDHNNDGFPTLILPPRDGSSFSSRIVDASAFLAGSVNGSTSIPARTITYAPVLGDDLKGPVTVLDDMTGDGVPELHFFSLSPDAVILNGSAIGTALESAGVTNYQIPPTEGTTFDHVGGAAGVSPVIIGDSYLLAVNTCLVGAQDCSGAYAWSLAAITEDVDAAATKIILK